MQKSKFRFTIWTLFTLLFFLLFAAFLLFPILQIFGKSFQIGGVFSLDNFTKIFSKKYYTNTLKNSFWVTIAATASIVLIGVPMAYIMKTVKIKGKGLIEILIIITMLSPPFIGAYSWILLLGRNGSITNILNSIFNIKLGGIYGFAGIVLVFTAQMYPLIYLYVSGAIRNMDTSLLEASECFGCVGFSRIRKIVLPLILPTLLASAMLVFMRVLADFGTPMLIGEGYRTMPVLIYTTFLSEMGSDDGFAAALCVLLVIFTMLIFMFQQYIVNRKSFSMSSMNPIEPKKLTGWKNAVAHIFVYAILALGLLPQLTVLYTSFLKTKGNMFSGGFSLQSYQEAFGKVSSIWNSYKFGFISIVLIVIIGSLIAYLTVRKRSLATGALDILSMMPYVIPGSVLGISFVLAFNKKPLLLTGTAFILIVSYVVRRLPYTIRSSAAILRQISPSVEEASISLGASNLKTFTKVTAPMMASGVISGAIMSFITVISELSSTMLLYVSNTQTLSVTIFTEVSRANYGVGAALSVILTGSIITVLLLFFKFSGQKSVSI